MRARLVVLLTLAAGSAPAAPDPSIVQARVTLHGMPLSVIANVGQSPPGVEYEIRGGLGVAFTRDAVVLGSGLRMRLVSASASTRPVPASPLPGVANFYFGSDPAEWREAVPTFAGVTYADAWPGIDAAWSGDTGRLKTEFRVSPGADVGSIRLAWDGPDATARVATDGSLIVETASGCVVDEAPIAWQEFDGGREPVAARFVVHADGSVGFDVKGWTRGPLVIDPALDFSTWWGGSDADEVAAVSVDSSRRIRVAGNTRSTDFPVLFAEQPANAGGIDLFVTEIYPGGDAIAWSTYIGGSEDDVLLSENLGHTRSPDFPLGTWGGSYGGRFGVGGGRDAFLLEGPLAGGLLGRAWVAGGSGDDEFVARGDSWGAVVGTTTSVDLPTVGGTWTGRLRGTSDAFVLAFGSTSGGPLTVAAGMYLGGSGDEVAKGAGAEKATGSGSKDFAVAGQTTSPDFPGVSGSRDSSLDGSSDAFVVLVNHETSASPPLWQGRATYLGGSRDDAAAALGRATLGTTESLIVTGWTDSADFPVLLPYQPALAGGRDAMLAALSRDLGTLMLGTYLGGSADDEARTFTYESDRAGTLLSGLVGWTESPDFPTVDALQPVHGGGRDGFHAVLVPHPAGARLRRATFFGGTADEEIRANWWDSSGCLYLGGVTTSADLPIRRNVQPAYAGASDGFVARICEHLLPESGEVELGDIWGRLDIIENMTQAIEAKLDQPPSHQTILDAVLRTETGVAQVEAKLDAPPSHQTILNGVLRTEAGVAQVESKLDRLPDLSRVEGKVDAVEAKLDRLPDLSAVEGKVDALEAKADAGAAEHDIDRLIHIEVMLHEKQCVPSLWLPAADGGLFEIARAHVARLVDRAEANGDPHANVRLARQKLADSDANAATGRYERACMDLSEALRAISPE